MTRRRFVQAAAGAGVVGLAGCTGDETQEVRVGTSTGGTFDVGLAMESAVGEHSDEVMYSTIESPGYIGTAYRMADGEFDAGIVDNNSMSKAQEQVGEFEEDPVDTLPWQGFLGFPYSIYLVAREDTDIETFDDLAGAAVYPAEPGFSTRETTLDVWSQDPTADVYDEMEIVDMDVSDAPGAMEEGNIDAAIAYGTPGVGNTGWVVEYDARTDVQYVEHTDELVESIESYDGAGFVEYDDVVDEFNWQQDIGADEIVAWDLEVTFTFHHDTPDDAVYEIMRVADEHGDAVRDAEERFTPDGAEEMAASGMDDYPFHPGAAEYYQDAGVWNDDWIVGDPDEAGDYF